MAQLDKIGGSNEAARFTEVVKLGEAEMTQRKEFVVLRSNDLKRLTTINDLVRRRVDSAIDHIETAVLARGKPKRIADLLKLLRRTIAGHLHQQNAYFEEIRPRTPHSTDAAADAVSERLEARFRSLTSRERQVLELVVKANSNKQIAVILGIGRRTVETHRASVMKKVGARSIAELIILTIVG